MDIAEITRRTSIATRRLRYVLDHAVLPGTAQASQGRGTARSFTSFEAFGLSCAALLLDAGLRRSLVRQVIELLTHGARGTDVNAIPLYRAFDAGGYLEIGDAVNVRLQERPAGKRPALDTGWLQAATGAALDQDYEPLVLLRLNVSVLRRTLSD